MDVINAWAIKIAEQGAPDEVDLAPVMAHAYLSGGKDREELFCQDGGALQGAFGPEFGMAVFPFLLQALIVTSVPLRWLLTSPYVENLAAINDLLRIPDWLNRKKKAEALPDDRYASLKKVILTMSTELRSNGLDPDRADLVTIRVVRAMLEEPSGAAEFVKKIEQAP